MQYRNIYIIEKIQETSKIKGEKTHFFKDNLRTNKGPRTSQVPVATLQIAGSGNYAKNEVKKIIL